MLANIVNPVPLIVIVVPAGPVAGVGPAVKLGDAAPVNVAERLCVVDAQNMVAAYDPPTIIGPVIVYCPVTAPVALEVPDNTLIALPKLIV